MPAYILCTCNNFYGIEFGKKEGHARYWCENCNKGFYLDIKKSRITDIIQRCQ